MVVLNGFGVEVLDAIVAHDLDDADLPKDPIAVGKYR
jgi:hypothetical protein